MDIDTAVEMRALVITKLAVTSRMAKVPLEKELPTFLGYPSRAETLRLPSRATRLTFSVGKHRGRRVVVDQRSTAIQQAARTLVRRVLAEAALSFVIEHE